MRRSSGLIIRLSFGVLFGLGAAASGCGGTDGAAPAAITFDPCAPLTLVPDVTVTPAELAGIAAAAALWNGRAQTSLVAPPSPEMTGTSIDAGAGAAGPGLPVHFQPAAGPFHGLYDGENGTVFVNDDLSAAELPIVLAHEIGHAFGLVHVSPAVRPSLMNPDNLDVAPTDVDVTTLGGLWGRCGSLDADASE